MSDGFPLRTYLTSPSMGEIWNTEPVFLNFLGAQESIPKEPIPPSCVAWWAGTTTLFLLGS
jgi:hypothetical protein